MKVFYFDVWDGLSAHYDQLGLPLDGPEAAFEVAVLNAREMIEVAVPRGWEALTWSIHVRDDTGRRLFTLPLSVAPLDPHYGAGRLT